MEQNKVSEALIQQVKYRLFEECIPRIKKCIHQLSTDQIWWRPNENSNSIGNLILHLNGNVRQWILTGIDQQTDIRTRKKEFTSRQNQSAVGLSEILSNLQTDVVDALNRLDSSTLMEMRDVQIYKESGVSILVHVTEHFSYHTGQIAYITKMIKDEPLAFYDESKLDI